MSRKSSLSGGSPPPAIVVSHSGEIISPRQSSIDAHTAKIIARLEKELKDARALLITQKQQSIDQNTRLVGKLRAQRADLQREKDEKDQAKAEVDALRKKLLLSQDEVAELHDTVAILTTELNVVAREQHRPQQSTSARVNSLRAKAVAARTQEISSDTLDSSGKNPKPPTTARPMTSSVPGAVRAYGSGVFQLGRVPSQHDVKSSSFCGRPPR